MIKSIFNWVGGGFFRTIGRFVAFVVLGAVAYILIGKSNIKISDLLGIEMVKADTWQTAVVRWQNESGNNLPQYYGQYKNYNFGTPYVNNPFIIQNGIEYPAGTKGVLFSVYFRELRAKNEYICTQTYSNSDDCFIWTQNSGQNMSFNIAYNNGNNEFNCYWYDNQFMVLQDNNNYVKGLLYCPLPSNVQYKKITKLMYTGSVESYQSSVTTYSIGIDPTIMWDVSGDSQVSSSIDTQTQQQQQQHNETMNYIQDTNMTETNSTATSFFDNFSDTDHGGLSSIITAPLSTINNMLSNTCVAPSATWKGSTITLPCGDLLWSRPGADDLRSLLNVFYGGFVCYYAIRRLFFLIENLKDPTKDNLEVTDL